MIKTINQQELKSRIESEQALYRDRVSGINMTAGIDPVTGRTIPKIVDGGVQTFPVPNAFEVLPVYFEAVAQGNTPHPAGLVQVGLDQYGAPTFDLYMYKPEKIQKLALDKIAKEVEAAYLAEIESANEQFIQEQVDAQLRVDAAREERARAVAAAELRAKVEKDIRATFQPAEEVAVPTAPTRGRK